MRRHISHIMAAVISMAAVFSCAAKSDLETAPDDSVFTASGTVHVDDHGSMNPATIKGVRIIMTSYGVHDILKLFPVERDTSYTDRAGKYESSLEMSKNRYYDILAEDIDGADNGGEFQPYLMDGIYPGKKNRLENILLYMKRK
ncbi:MAG: hypothetical protein KBT05_00630 [Bacteroidales bacterium]|nr:hypothetical protein [Candidatus Cryptobacteroides caccocaballi]